MEEAKESLKGRIPHKDSDEPTLAYFNSHVRSLIADRWEDVAVQLLSEEHQKEINIIKADHYGDVKKCCTSLFTIWRQRQPQDVTWRALIRAIKKADLTNEANQIEKMLMTLTVSPAELDDPETPSSSSQLDTLLSPSTSHDLQLVHMKCTITKLDEEVRRDYAHFTTELLKLFTKLQVSKADILFTFSSLEGHSAVTGEMRSAEDLQSFMLALTRSQSWYNFGTLASLACTFGEDEGNKLVELYEQKLKVHLLKRITRKPLDTVKTDKIVVKFDKKREHFTEEKIIKFRNTLAKLLKLEPEEFVFVSIESGCVKLTFLFPSQHIPHIIHNINSGTLTDDLNQCDVMSVIIQGEILWQRKVPRHKKRGHDDVVTTPKKLKTASTSFHDMTTTTSAFSPVMRSFPISSSVEGRQPITYTVLLYRIICSTRRKCIISLATVLVILCFAIYCTVFDKSLRI